MRHRFLGTAGALLLTAAGLSAESISWQKDLASAQAEAKTTGKIMMVDVYTDWCGWCKKLDSDTYSDARVIAKAKDFVSLKLNPEASDAGAAFAQKYGVTGYPCILFLEPDGTVVNRIGGYMEAEPFAAAMARTQDYRTKIKAYLSEYQSGKLQNAEALLSMLLETGRTGEARPVFDRLAKDAKWDASRRGSSALAIANALVEGEDFTAALDYLKIVEDLGPKAEGAVEARWAHAVAVFYVSGKKQALAYLDGVLRDRNTPKEWKDPLQELRGKINAASDPKGN